MTEARTARAQPGGRGGGSAPSSAAAAWPVLAVAHRCRCGLPDVVQTAPRLPDGTPFPTLYYLTCPRASAAAAGWRRAG